MTATQAAQCDSWSTISQIRGDDELVLATQALKPGTNEATLSRFGDDRWDLAPAILRENVPRSIATVNFAVLHDPLQRLTGSGIRGVRLSADCGCGDRPAIRTAGRPRHGRQEKPPSVRNGEYRSRSMGVSSR